MLFRSFQRDVLAGRTPALQLAVDATRISQAFSAPGAVQQIVLGEVNEFVQRYRGGSAAPVELVLRARFNPFLTPAWFGSLMEIVNNITMLSIILTGAALIREREHGTIEHLLVMPVTPTEIMLAKVWSMGLVVLFAAWVSLTVVVRGLLQVPIEGSLALFLFGTAVHLFAMTSMGIFMATLARSMPQFGVLLMLTLIPLQLLSGGVTPRESMPVFVRDLIWPAVIVMNLIFFLHGSLSLADFTIILSTALIFTATVWDAVWNISQFGLMMAKTDEAHTYLFGNQIVKATGSEVQTRIIPFRKAFEIRGLSFAYPDKPDEEVLHDISLSLKQGEKLGIVGRSGSGKSTLTKLLLDYYEVKNEPFYFDNKSVPSETVARSIAFVPQDTTLFHRSIAENISYGSPKEVTNEMVIAAAKQAEADEFIGKLADGYDTLVGERGVKLSGGQRQRIAIARAILRDAPILVLDEATSSLDSESELHIQRALENLWHDKTVIAIAHRLSTLRKMDRIIVMDSGHIVEEGTHHQLLEQNGTYAKLWAHQSGGFIDE